MRKETRNFIVLITILALATILLYSPIKNLINEPEFFQEKIQDLGALGPISFLLIHIIQIVVAIIPGQLTEIAGGYLFGTYLGIFYNLAGSMLGNLAVFLLTKKYGRPFAKKMVSKKNLEKFDRMVHDKGLAFVFIAFLIPIFPSDALAYVLALTKIRFSTYMLITTIGRIPGIIIFSAMGGGIDLHNPVFIIVTAIMAISSIGAYMKKEEIENFFIKKKNGN